MFYDMVFFMVIDAGWTRDRFKQQVRQLFGLVVRRRRSSPLYLYVLDLTQRMATTMMMMTMDAAARATTNQVSR